MTVKLSFEIDVEVGKAADETIADGVIVDGAKSSAYIFVGYVSQDTR